jgi:hypothetical protein
MDWSSGKKCILDHANQCSQLHSDPQDVPCGACVISLQQTLVLCAACCILSSSILQP